MASTRQFNVADTLTSGAQKDETSCFTSFLNVLTWPFRKIGELFSILFCYKSSINLGTKVASDDTNFIKEIENNPEQAAQLWFKKYPNIRTSVEKLTQLSFAITERPDVTKGLAQNFTLFSDAVAKLNTANVMFSN